MRIAGEERFIDAADAGLYRDALGVVPPGGLPEAFLAEVPDSLTRLLRRYAATHGPFLSEDPGERFGIGAGGVQLALRELERTGELVLGELRPGGRSGQREWCDTEVLRRLRRASLAVLRKEIEPADRRAFAVFLPGWHGVDRHPSSGAGVDRLREQLVALQGLALTPGAWEREVLPRRVGAYSATWMDELCASGELVWIGAGALGRKDGRVALYFREDAALLAPALRRATPSEGPSGEEHALLRARLTTGSCFFTDLLADIELAPQVIAEALWDLVWAGEVTNDAFTPLRAPRLSLARSEQRAPRRSSSGRFSSRRASARGSAGAHPAGRWSLTTGLLQTAAGQDELSPATRRRALAELLLERHGILTRELVLAEAVPGGFSAIYPELCQLETLGVARRGYFVEGLGGAQFALPGAVERLRALPISERSPLVLSAVDPAQPYGAALAWPKRPSETRRPARVQGANVVLVGGEPVLYLERGGKALQVLVDPDHEQLPAALGALAEHARMGRLKKIALEKVDGEPVLGTRWEAALEAVGFQAGPRRLTLSV
jgi:ATP-dependent Lhr-like helicase